MTDHPSLAAVVAAMTGDPLSLDAPPSWGQGRTLYGGMTAAIGWAAATRTFPGLPPLRSMQAAFVAPAAGRLTFAPTLLRQGKSAVTIGVDIHGEAGLAARLTFFCGAARASVVAHQRTTPPHALPPDAYAPILGSGLGPTFTRHFDIRSVTGWFPAGGGEPDYLMLVRLHDAEGCNPLVEAIAIADVTPPAAMAVFPQPGIISTLSWSLDLDRVPERAGDFYLARASAESTADGYSRQTMDLWDVDGNRLLGGRQTIAIFV